MIRVVIDTNVLVSALLTGGLPEAVVDLAISGEVQWFASESILAEYEDVIKRPRLAIDSDKAADAMARIRAIVSIVSPNAPTPRKPISLSAGIFAIFQRSGKRLAL
jgi:putative PIN family toxin of toxin-antitoxin system